METANVGKISSYGIGEDEENGELTLWLMLRGLLQVSKCWEEGRHLCWVKTALEDSAVAGSATKSMGKKTATVESELHQVESMGTSSAVSDKNTGK